MVCKPYFGYTSSPRPITVDQLAANKVLNYFAAIAKRACANV